MYLSRLRSRKSKSLTIIYSKHKHNISGNRLFSEILAFSNFCHTYPDNYNITKIILDHSGHRVTQQCINNKIFESMTIELSTCFIFFAWLINFYCDFCSRSLSIWLLMSTSNLLNRSWWIIRILQILVDFEFFSKHIPSLFTDSSYHFSPESNKKEIVYNILLLWLVSGAGVKMEHFQATLDPRKQELLEARFLGARVSP